MTTGFCLSPGFAGLRPRIDVFRWPRRARASNEPHELDTEAGRSYCSLFPAGPLLIYNGKHLHARRAAATCRSPVSSS